MCPEWLDIRGPSKDLRTVYKNVDTKGPESEKVENKKTRQDSEEIAPVGPCLAKELMSSIRKKGFRSLGKRL